LGEHGPCETRGGKPPGRKKTPCVEKREKIVKGGTDQSQEKKKIKKRRSGRTFGEALRGNHKGEKPHRSTG